MSTTATTGHEHAAPEATDPGRDDQCHPHARRRPGPPGGAAAGRSRRSSRTPRTTAPARGDDHRRVPERGAHQCGQEHRHPAQVRHRRRLGLERAGSVDDAGARRHRHGDRGEDDGDAERHRAHDQDACHGPGRRSGATPLGTAVSISTDCVPRCISNVRAGLKPARRYMAMAAALSAPTTTWAELRPRCSSSREEPLDELRAHVPLPPPRVHGHRQKLRRPPGLLAPTVAQCLEDTRQRGDQSQGALGRRPRRRAGGSSGTAGPVPPSRR